MITLFGQSFLWNSPEALVVGGLLLLLVGLLLLTLRSAGKSAKSAEPLMREMAWMSQRVQSLSEGQERLAGGLHHVSENQAVSQTAMLQVMEQRLAEVTRQMGESLHGTATRTARSLGELQQRLETIDKAQANIEKLSGNVLNLQDILANKQARGAFGEVRLEQIVEDVLPAELYEFQATLSNRARVDCLIRFSERGGDLAVDSKFPLESYRSMLAAGDDATRIVAERQFKVDVKKHIDDISSKYLIKGETRDLALMFIPAESIYGELLQHFADLVEYASKKRVYLASPNTIHGWLTNLRSVYIDTKIAAQASLIQREVRLILDDVGRLGERVESLETHFGQANKDIEQIKTSAKKVLDRGEKIERVELSAGDDPTPPALQD